MTEDVRRCYDVLGLEPGAGADEVKKAYFRLVRAHPPEKDPEAFQEIRQAYERLKDGPPVMEDDRFSIPDDPGVQFFLNHAHQALKKQDYRSAAACFSEALTFAPDNELLLLHLARLQRRAGNPRKAANTAKKLQKLAPDCAEAYAIAAGGYYESGWYKKAFPEYKRAVELGYHDLEFFLDYADVADANGERDIADQQRRALLRETKWDKSNIDSAIYLFGKQFEHVAGEAEVLSALGEYDRFLKTYRRLLKGYGIELATPLLHAISEKPFLLRFHPLYEKTDNLLSAADAADRDTVLGLRSQLLEMALEADPAFSKDWKMLALVVTPPDDDDSRLQRYAALDLLLCLMKEREQSLRMFSVIERDYPYFYEHVRQYRDFFSADHFDERFEKSKRELARLAEYYDGGFFYERYPEKKTLPRGTLAYSDSKPFVRETKKPGRNDPCPCGSGLKFKRCCLGKGIYD